MNSQINVALAQISPVWLNKKATLEKILDSLQQAKNKGAELVVFGEALLPGYPFWLALTDGAAWNKTVVKELHRQYVLNSVDLEAGDLDAVCAFAKANKIAIYLGLIERPQDRGGHSIYASMVYINQNGEIKSSHRKLQPTYDERLTWAPGDGHGLVTHKLKDFTMSGLNCWENWMPLPRAAMYAQGTNLHVACWPGSDHNTRDITRFIAREGRTFVLSVSSMMTRSDLPSDTLHLEEILQNCPDVLANGGSCIAGPDGEWIIEPQIGKEEIITATLDFNRIYEERQNFDAVGHYSRPDVTQLHVNRERQSTVRFED
ncbi:carbon-nitrogen hydrolase family protein [Nonlabens ponticola]|uniref:Carbon-nitrogen hydrolase family protein n=1 Tax=Nonlabens ponticola TaxID=2496866 RepID=A0A3S9MWS9_9FLAO|nr:carbon-nitrogen hydrolase family protein [Nonlabens ponticola]AZQ43594.1 carbon-nitrogen hydrolase family protein [Nonlabens ponticola]